MDIEIRLPRALERRNLLRITKFLGKVGEPRKITIHIDSDGGDTVETMNLIEALEAFRDKALITTVAKVALSSGALIFLVGDRRIIYSDGILYLHGVTMSVPVYMLDDGRLPKDRTDEAWKLQERVEGFILSRIPNFRPRHVESFMRTERGMSFLPDIALEQGLATEVRQVPIQTFFGFSQDPTT